MAPALRPVPTGGAATGIDRGTTLPARAGDHRDRLFQPLLLAGASLAALPLVIASGSVPFILLLSAGIAMSVAAWLWGRRATVSGQARLRLALILIGVAVAGLILLIASFADDAPAPFLPLAAAVSCSLAAVPSPFARIPIQVATLGGVGVFLALGDVAVLDVVLSLVLLASLSYLANVLADALVAARRAQAEAHAEAVRRADLLSAVRELPGTGMQEAAEAACRTLRNLGFDGAGVAIVRTDSELRLYLDGIPDPPGRRTSNEGVVARALAQDRTVVVADYQADPDRLSNRTNVGSAVVVPIRVDGRPIGVLIGVREAATEPRPAEVEVAEVMAAHLGVVFDTDARLRRQRELLERMHRLELMRAAFVAEVSDELRHPLTVVRGIGQTLAARDVDLGPERREDLLQRMGAQTEQLRATIDALLDFSGFQATRPEPHLRPIPVRELLTPVAKVTAATLALDAEDLTVEVDVDLVRHALELLLGGEGRARGTSVRVTSERGRAVIEVDEPEVTQRARPGIVRTLAVQLLVLGGARLAEEGDHIELVQVVEVAP